MVSEPPLLSDFRWSTGTGKTSLIQLLLDTADIPSTTTLGQRAAVNKFIRGAPEHTQ